MKRKVILILLSLSLIFSSNILAGGDDVCGTTSGTSASYLPTSGTIKIFVIFAQFKDDPKIENNGWTKNSYPDWANTFVNPSTGGSYPWNNLSHYFNEMSSGSFQVIGDVYDSLVITDNNENYYNSIGQVNREIILKVDPYVDFSEYDNLNGNSFGSDGKVDFIYIIYRNVTMSSFYYTGIARLEVSSTINVDGKQVVNNSYIGGGVQQKGGYNGRDYTLYVAAHEMGHYLFGGGHISNVSNLALMTGGPVWNASRGMHSWERQKLGWLNYTNQSTDGSVTMLDYMTAAQVYRVPISSTEYFLIENRKQISPHDKAEDSGFYFYRVTGASSFPPTIDVLCADGNWDFSINTLTQTLTKTTPNVNGKNEMNFIQVVNGVTYACYTPIYHNNSAWGDEKDAFDLTFNNVLSPVSNPRSNNGGSLDFTIEVTGTNTIQFYFTNPYAGKPSKPQNLHFTYSDPNHPSLGWYLNDDDDISIYRIYRNYDNSGWNLAGSVMHPTNSFVDYSVDYTKPIWAKSVKYYVIAVDNTNLSSVPSEQVETNGIMIPQFKLSSENYANNSLFSEPNMYFRLDDNFPNPFNPETNISFSIPERSFVTLKIYDSLGREVKELVNDFVEKGHYTKRFDGSNLSSGIYFYKLTAGNNNTIKKMLLVK